MKEVSFCRKNIRLNARRKLPVTVSLGLLLSVFSCFSIASADLVLAGGALKTCSSMSMKNCSSASRFDSAKSEILYEVNKESIARYQVLSKKYAAANDFLYSKLVNINSSKTGLTKNELFDALNDEGFSNSDIRGLSDAEYFVLLDALEMQQLDENGARLQEKVSLASTKEKASVDVYTAFIEGARAKHAVKHAFKQKTAGDKALNTTTRIGVVTASSRDPFEAVDFYLGVFQQPNVEVVWLPLSPAFQKAAFVESMGGNGCEQLEAFRAQHNLYDKGRLYPQRSEMQRQWCKDSNVAINTLSNLDGIFFNGGDQSKTLAALSTPTGEPTPFLKTLRSMWRNDQIIVGGTSAGTAVQAGGYANGRPVPMLTSGSSKGVLSSGVFSVPPVSERCEDEGCEHVLVDNAVTVNPTGGLGLFNFGLLDTHFSERDREVRLIAATAQSLQQFGFGVDETTALVVDMHNNQHDNQQSAEFTVVGKSGVFIVDLGQGRVEESRNGAAASRVVAGLASFLPTGAKGTIVGEKLTIDLTASSKQSSTQHKRKNDDGVWREQSMRLCRDGIDAAWELDGTQHVLKKSADSTVLRSHYCGYSNVPFLVYEP
jgi:cyanophycinase